MSGSWLWAKKFAKVIVRNTVYVRLVFHFCVPTGILHWIESIIESKTLTMVWYSASSDVEEGRKQGLPGQSVPEGVVRDNTSAAFVQVGTCSADEISGVTQRRSGGTIGSGIVTDREKYWGNYFLQQLPLPKNSLN
eukprot:651424-Amphidinium_carterae.1